MDISLKKVEAYAKRKKLKQLHTALNKADMANVREAAAHHLIDEQYAPALPDLMHAIKHEPIDNVAIRIGEHLVDWSNTSELQDAVLQRMKSAEERETRAREKLQKAEAARQVQLSKPSDRGSHLDYEREQQSTSGKEVLWAILFLLKIILLVAAFALRN